MLRRPPVNAPLREHQAWVPPSPVRVALLLLAALATAFAFAGLIGWWAGGAAQPEDVPQAPPRLVTTAVGPAKVETAPAWRHVAPGPEATGLDRARTAVFSVATASPARAVLTIGPAADATLVPAALRAHLQGAVGSPTPTRLLGRPAWLYAQRPARGGAAMDVTVLPTTAGVLAIACTAPRTDFTDAAGCVSGVRGLALHGAQPLAPSPTLALRRRLPAVIQALDARRVPLRATLSRAKTRREQSRLAARLATAYARASAELAPLVPAGAKGGVPGRLAGTRLAYHRLARAAGRARPKAYARARRGVGGAEKALAAALARAS